MSLERKFEKCYLLEFESEEKFHESIINLIKEYSEGKIPAHLFVKSLDIGNQTIQELYNIRNDLDKMIREIRYRLIEISEYLKKIYDEDDIGIFAKLDQNYTDKYNDFTKRSEQFFKEWERYEEENNTHIYGLDIKTKQFELVFKMINLVADDYDEDDFPSREMIHIYILARELPGLLINARNLALCIEPRMVANKYFMEKYLSDDTTSNYTTIFNRPGPKLKPRKESIDIFNPELSIDDDISDFY